MFLEKNVTNFNDDFIQYSEKKEKRESKHQALSLSVQIICYVLLIFFAIFFIWYTAFISTHQYYLVYGASMKDTLNSSLSLNDGTSTQDAVYVDYTSKIKLFDIIVAKRENKKNAIIKRVMAFEGDYISVAVHKDSSGNSNFYYYRIAAGTDLSNFEDEAARLDESLGINSYNIYGYESWAENRDALTFVDEGNANISTYNKHFYEEAFFARFLEGKLNDIDGGSEDYFVSESGLVYVKVPKGKFFCMGDNRAFSSDSREKGFYDLKEIVGRVEIVVYNHNFGKRIASVVKYYFSEIEKFFAR